MPPLLSTVHFAADVKELKSDGTGSTLCTDAADGALTTAQQQSYIYKIAQTPGQFTSGDLLTPSQTRTVLIAVMNALCPQLAARFTFRPPG